MENHRAATLTSHNRMPGGFFGPLFSLIDRWDEAAAAEDDGNKVETPFAVGAGLAFPDLPANAELTALAGAAAHAVADPEAFYGPPNGGLADYRDGWLTFPSLIQTEDAANNTASARILEVGNRKAAVILVPHWNSRLEAMGGFASVLNRVGFSTAILTLPYHHHRSRSESTIADYFVSANLGRTIRSVRQAVSDLRGVINWFERGGYDEFYVIGASLGTCIAGLAGAVDRRVRASVLLLTAGSFADVVWTGRATRHIRTALQSGITLEQLREAWSIISLDSFIDQFRKHKHQILVVSATRDQVILPIWSKDFLDKLGDGGVSFQHSAYSCGHYSLAIPPFSVFAGFRAWRFLKSCRPSVVTS